MIKPRSLLLLLFSVLLLPFTSCDNDDNEDPEPTRRDLLVAGTWTGTAIYANGRDVTQLFTEAGFDISKNTISFNKAGTYIDTYDGATENGSWELTSDEQSIVLDKGTNHEISVRIVRLTDAEFFVDQPVELEDGSTAIIELRYSR